MTKNINLEIARKIGFKGCLERRRAYKQSNNAMIVVDSVIFKHMVDYLKNLFGERTEFIAITSSVSDWKTEVREVIQKLAVAREENRAVVLQTNDLKHVSPMLVESCVWLLRVMTDPQFEYYQMNCALNVLGNFYEVDSHSLEQAQLEAKQEEGGIVLNAEYYHNWLIERIKKNPDHFNKKHPEVKEIIESLQKLTNENKRPKHEYLYFYQERFAYGENFGTGMHDIKKISYSLEEVIAEKKKAQNDYYKDILRINLETLKLEYFTKEQTWSEDHYDVYSY